MPVYKIHKTSDYTVMSNVHLRDKRLTLKAKGLLSLMLCLPPTWNHSIAGFTAICKEGRHSISSAFKELEECGYVNVDKKLPEKGSNHISYVYNIFEVPQGFEVSAGQDSSRFSALDYSTLKSAAENQAQINKDNQEDMSLSGEVEFQQDCSSTTYNLLVSSGFVPPTLDEVKDFFATNLLDQSDSEDFWLHYQSQNWVRGNGIPVGDWHALAVSWNKHDKVRRSTEKRDTKPDYGYLNDGWEVG